MKNVQDNQFFFNFDFVFIFNNKKLFIYVRYTIIFERVSKCVGVILLKIIHSSRNSKPIKMKKIKLYEIHRASRILEGDFFGGFYFTREFTNLETSLLPVNGYTILPMLGNYGH